MNLAIKLSIITKRKWNRNGKEKRKGKTNDYIGKDMRLRKGKRKRNWKMKSYSY